MMPIQDANFIWKIYWKLFLGKMSVIFGKLIITKERSPGMAILLLAIPILKELSKP
jgi:hypothetical protein